MGRNAGQAWKAGRKLGKYVLTPIAAITVYNNARADGLSPAQATAIATAEVVNPLPLGYEELRDVGRWHDQCMETAFAIGHAEMTESELRSRGLLGNDSGFMDTWGNIGKNRLLMKELLDNTRIESRR